MNEIKQVSANSKFFYFSIFHLGRYQAKANMKTKMKIPPRDVNLYDTCIYMVEWNFPILLNNIHSSRKEVSVSKKEVNPVLMQDRRRYLGRNPKLNSRDERKIIREITRLWEHFGDTFTVRRVKYASRLADVSERTAHTAPNAAKE